MSVTIERGSVLVTAPGGKRRVPFEAIESHFEHAGVVHLVSPEFGETPWVRLEPRVHNAESVASILRSIESSRGRGYREAVRPEAPAMDARSLYHAAVAHRPIPGALVVRGAPVREMRHRSRPLTACFVAGAGVGLLLSGFAVLLGVFFDVSDPASILAIAPMLTLSCAVGATLLYESRLPKQAGRRRAIIARGGAMILLPSGPRAFDWAELGPASIAPSHYRVVDYSAVQDAVAPPPIDDALHFVDRHGHFLGEIPRCYAKEPLERIAAFAEHCRRRAAR